MTNVEKEIIKMAIAAGVSYTATLGSTGPHYQAIRVASPNNPYAKGE